MTLNRGKEPVVIKVQGEEVVLQVPCPHCKGSQFGTYRRDVPRTKIGPCQECEDGLIDTPIFAAIKLHLGILPELEGRWLGREIFVPRLGLGNLPLIDGAELPLHFYQTGEPSSRNGLCNLGVDVTLAAIPHSDQANESNRCGNCIRIKKAREAREAREARILQAIINQTVPALT